MQLQRDRRRRRRSGRHRPAPAAAFRSQPASPPASVAAARPSAETETGYVPASPGSSRDARQRVELHGIRRSDGRAAGAGSPVARPRLRRRRRGFAAAVSGGHTIQSATPSTDDRGRAQNQSPSITAHARPGSTSTGRASATAARSPAILPRAARCRSR